VAYVVLYGWDKFTELYRRFRNIPPIDLTTDSLPETASKETTNISTMTNETDDSRFISQESEHDNPPK
jgi:hypothetical protein